MIVTLLTIAILLFGIFCHFCEKRNGWCTRLNALTAHIVVDNKVDGHLVKSKLRKVLSQLGIEHATLELEDANEECTANETCCHS